MTIAPGAKLPDLTVTEITPDGPADATTDALFSGKRVVVVAVVGAFTGTCSLDHVPGYIDNRDEILAKGVDDIAIVAINDPHVVKAWAEHTGGMGKLRFIADWDAAFTKALGMDLDLSAGRLGVRSHRYAMIVNDGTVERLDVEDNPGEATVSSAAHLLKQLG